MILFFYGPNTYEARQQIAKLVAQYKKKTDSDIGIERIDGAKATIAQLRAALQAAPFLAASRLVIVESVGSNKSVAPKVPDILPDIPASTVAVFYDPNADKRTVYTKGLQAKATRAIEFKPLSRSQLQAWAAKRATELGATIQRPAMAKLLEMTGDDQWRLDNELAKLSLYDSAITLEAVELMVEPSSADNVFALIEAVTAGKTTQGLKSYHQLVEDGNNQIYILSMIIWQLRNLLLAKLAGRVTPSQLAKQVGMSPYVAEKMLSKRHLFSEKQLQQAFLRAVETDYQIKSGGGPADVLVERLIADIAQSVKATGSSRSSAKSARSR